MESRSVSLVSTILNDLTGAQALLADLCAQTRQPDEFVVVDGGSTDGTWEYLVDQSEKLPFPLRLYREHGANVSRGRNLAIDRAQYDIIVSTDFGCRLDEDWFRQLAVPFGIDRSVEIVTGSWKIRNGDVQTPAQWAEYALAAGQLGLKATSKCLASTRSIAFHKQVWENFGRYPEDLTLAGDDAMFSLWMVAAGRQIAAAPEAICYWHRFRRVGSYFREARRNSRGAGEAVFFLSFGVKTGALFLLEWLSVFTTAVASVACSLGILPWQWVGTLMAAMLIIWSRRFVRWIRAITILHSVNRLRFWPWVIGMDIGLRFNGVVGYWHGFLSGFRKCRQCRERMRTLAVPRW